MPQVDPRPGLDLRGRKRGDDVGDRCRRDPAFRLCRQRPKPIVHLLERLLGPLEPVDRGLRSPATLVLANVLVLGPSLVLLALLYQRRAHTLHPTP